MERGRAENLRNRSFALVTAPSMEFTVQDLARKASSSADRILLRTACSLVAVSPSLSPFISFPITSSTSITTFKEHMR